MVRLVFYYDSLSYSNVDEEHKMTVDSLIGTIGGHLHLFLGMSLLSFVEISVLGLKFIHKLMTCFSKYSSSTNVQGPFLVKVAQKY